MAKKKSVNKQGRPSKYNEEMLKKAEHYIIGGFSADEDVIPTMAGLALYLKVDKTTLYEWAKKHEEFSHSLNRLNYHQEKITLNQALINKFNAHIAGKVLANHGYTDKSAFDLTSSDKSMSPQEPKADLSKLDLETLLKLRETIDTARPI